MGNVKILQCLIDRGVDFDAKLHRCGTLLQAAKEVNHDETIQLLRSRGVSEGQVGPSSHL